jgi:hypothetical protein
VLDCNVAPCTNGSREVIRAHILEINHGKADATKCQIGRRAYFPPGQKARTQSADNLLAAVVVEHAEAPLVHFLAKRLEERLGRGKHRLAQPEDRWKIFLD